MTRLATNKSINRYAVPKISSDFVIFRNDNAGLVDIESLKALEFKFKLYQRKLIFCNGFEECTDFRSPFDINPMRIETNPCLFHRDYSFMEEITKETEELTIGYAKYF